MPEEFNKKELIDELTLKHSAKSGEHLGAIHGLISATLEQQKKQGELLNKLIVEVKKKEEEERDIEIEIDKKELVGKKGDRGAKGERGLEGSLGDTGSLGQDGKQGKVGKGGSDGKDGKIGKTGKDGLDGADGKDGLDGSPDSPTDIKEKLELLIGGARLDAKAIKNLPALVAGEAGRRWQQQDDNASEKSWSFTSPAGSSGSFFYGGFYDRAGSANDFNPSTTFGTANSSYAAHFFLVQAAGASGGTDTVIRITGTTINDQGIRATGQTVDITVDDTGTAGTYYETTEKWIGQITIEKQSGPDLLCNYGFAKYWDNNNTDYTVKGIEAVWLGGANDAGIDIQVIHHKATGWTYNAIAIPDFTPLVTLQGDHVTEYEAVNGDNGAWKRDNLNTDINGGNGEGIIFCVITTANKAFELGNLMIRIVPQ